MTRIVGSIVFFFYALLVVVAGVSTSVFATSNSLVIAGVQLKGIAGANTSSQELVTIKNISDYDVDVTNWCVAYVAASNVNPPTNTAGCVTADDAATHLFLPAGGSLSFATNDYKLAHPTLATDFPLASGLSNTAGHLYMLDANKTVVDRVGWGNAINPETESVHLLSNTLGFVRGQDTDNNALDFSLSSIDLTPAPASLYGVVDICDNLDGIQTSLPDGYNRNADGSCLQLSSAIYCLGAEITELLPDPVGDTGNNGEFVELHNPTSQPISLKNCQLYVGASYSQHANLPDIELAPNTYQAFWFADTGLQLSNSNGRAKLTTADGTTIHETNPYTILTEGSVWALIDGNWQVSQKPTPDMPNELVINPGVGGGVSEETVDCPEGKYRNPETNRCKNIESALASLTNCAINQERNPVTNRCRTITAASSNLTSCDSGQQRNLQTNRCRKTVANEDVLKPCQAGYERNPDTNRCRKAVAAFTAGQDSNSKNSGGFGGLPVNAGWFAAGIIGSGAAGYGIYEWRSEILRLWQKLCQKIFRGQA